MRRRKDLLIGVYKKDETFALRKRCEDRQMFKHSEIITIDKRTLLYDSCIQHPLLSTLASLHDERLCSSRRLRRKLNKRRTNETTIAHSTYNDTITHFVRKTVKHSGKMNTTTHPDWKINSDMMYPKERRKNFMVM